MELHMIQQSHFWVYIKRIESRDLNRYLYTNIHSSIIHNSQGWTLPKHPWADTWIRKTQNVYRVENYSALKRKAILTHTSM